MRGKSSLQR